jgi:tight adherence protein C
MESMASPLLVAGLVFLAFGLVWMALAPARKVETVESRLDTYGQPRIDDLIDDQRMSRSFAARVLWPVIQRVLRGIGKLLPSRAASETDHQLLLAGRPGGLGALDFWGLRLLLGAILGGLILATTWRTLPIPSVLLRTGLATAVGFMLPVLWLGMRVRSRKAAILKALPNALDMLSIGVEAGLGFEASMLRVSEQWQNPLTREMQRTVMEIRVGSSRNQALQHLADRTGVPELSTFVAVLIQSTELGVSITEVLHQQAATMREKRRQRAESLARQAAIKMLFPLVFFIFPAMFVVILGPALPRIVEGLGGL